MKYLLFTVIAVVFASCKNPDELLPTIKSIKINGENDSHMIVIAGEQMVIDVEVEDNKNLKQIMLQLKAISGLHSHQISESEPTPFLRSLSFGSLDTTFIRTINGSQWTENFSLILPDSISGGCNMNIGVLDDNGNYYTKNYTLHVHNNEVPVVILNSVMPMPDLNGVVQLVNANQLPQFQMSGHLVDHTGLDLLTVRLYNSTASWQQAWEFQDGEWSFELENIVINDTLPMGTYTLELKTNDITNWTSIYRGTIKIP